MEYSFSAFIDESGDHHFNFDKEGTASHFVITALLLGADVQHDAAAKLHQVKSKYFPGSALSSERIGNRDAVREMILNDIKEIDFSFFCLVVDKRKIHENTGLQYKESFYKFLYGILYNNIYRTFKNIDIVADELISNEFVSSFKKYIKDHHQVTLFNQGNIEFRPSDNTVPLQFANLIGGSISRYVSGQSALNPFQLLQGKCRSKLVWPEDHEAFVVEAPVETDEFQDTISDLALLRIDDYINKHITSNDSIVRLRVMFLSYLRSVFLYNSKTRSVYTNEVIAHLANNSAEEINEQFIRRQIVGPLRSEGVLIVSNSTGYKIPSSKQDVITFFNLFSRTISPMISRLKKSHEALYQATDGKLNMLEFSEFAYLKKLFED